MPSFSIVAAFYLSGRTTVPDLAVGFGSRGRALVPARVALTVPEILDEQLARKLA